MSPSQKIITDDVRIIEIKELTPPSVLLDKLAPSKDTTDRIVKTRADIHRILHSANDRLLVVIGPCSIHDYDAGVEYAKRLLNEARKYSNELLIVMRVYFEKPRTTVGWKGLINDPHLDGSFDINEGLDLARRFLLEVNELGMPAATEFLDTITPQYTADLVSWGAIGARTPNPKFIVNWLLGCHARLVSKTVRMATSRLRSMPSRRLPVRITFYP